jgi:coenzyme Q-binding protein COQ10
MPSHKETRHVPFSASDMFALVAAVEKYPEFLPWCQGARVRSREIAGDKEILLADLLIAYKMFRERFTSRVTADKAAMTVDADYVKGPFHHLDNHWHFEPAENGCFVHFSVDFEFKSRTLEALIAGVFAKAVDRMVEAFIERAYVLYGETAN